MSHPAAPRVATRPVFRMRPSRVRRTDDGVMIDEVHEWIKATIGHRLEPFQRTFLNGIVLDATTATDPTEETP
jgi:hypothetical protein